MNINNKINKPASFPFSTSLATETTTQLYEEKYFTQILDHFNYNPISYLKFQQRYLINDKHWGGPKTKHPIFVYTGNEGDIEWFAQNTGFMFETAPRFRALLVFIEHRFYGKSIPFGGSKKIAYSNTTTLGYLSSTQALADYATLILDLKKNLTATDCPVVVFGGSYGGMLAAWFRLKYPHVAAGALASSAPILNFDKITSPYSFNDIITRDFKSESENCYKVIKGSWQEIEHTAKHNGLEILRKAFRICKNFISVDYLKNWLATAYLYTAMTDYPTPSNFLNPLPAYPVKQMCKAIDDPKTGNNTFEKLYAAANIYYNYTGQAKCFDLIDDSDPHDLGGWTWQACTEMILLTGGNREDSIFPAHNYSYNDRLEYCQSNFNITPRPSWIPTEFGGHNIYRDLNHFGSNIIFSNGLRDPWSGGGVKKDISESIVAIVAEKGAHHADLRFSTSEDPVWLKDMRRKEVHIISKWLSQYYNDLGYSHHPYDSKHP
ncbi:lysosomal pro-x carboxypeptidase [Phtheirospermum japonicum]|uniref:Lysosomal pro-x carboxypeptidase n=1 Tax=Phtheirospermum japonicum TaxID=374723 RepID=A0A830CVS5_9LAMI|nr:lysosomal pro-x carboxypeptidase [Phtheirospermum japonicum]